MFKYSNGMGFLAYLFHVLSNHFETFRAHVVVDHNIKEFHNISEQFLRDALAL